MSNLRIKNVKTLGRRDIRKPQSQPPIAAGAGNENMAPNQFRIPVSFQGSTTHFSVYIDPKLGLNGIAVAGSVLANCERDYSSLSGFFGGLQPDHFNVIITSGIDGAFHVECTGKDLYCDASGTNADFSSMLVVAESTEVFSALQNAGWDGECSNGEGLSRALAAELYPTEVKNFVCAPRWLDGSEHRRNYVDQNDPTDRNPQSTGCAVLFLYYLRSQLQFSWAAIVQAAAPTLAGVYRNLTGQNNAWEAFSTLIEANFPMHRPSLLRKDNPFPLPQKPAAIRGRNGNSIFLSGALNCEE